MKKLLCVVFVAFAFSNSSINAMNKLTVYQNFLVIQEGVESVVKKMYSISFQKQAFYRKSLHLYLRDLNALRSTTSGDKKLDKELKEFSDLLVNILVSPSRNIPKYYTHSGERIKKK